MIRKFRPAWQLRRKQRLHGFPRPDSKMEAKQTLDTEAIQTKKELGLSGLSAHHVSGPALSALLHLLTYSSEQPLRAGPTVTLAFR